MQYTGYSLAQEVSLESIVAGLTGATGVEGVIISNHADFTSKNTAANTKNTSQDSSLASLETKATSLEAGATGLEGRNATLTSDFVTLQSREDSLLAGLTGTAGATGLEARAVGFTNTITAINSNLNGDIRDQINTKVADSIFQSLKDDFEEDFTTFQNRLNQKVVTATQEVIDARQDSDDAVLEKKFCSIEEFAQTFLQTYTVAKPDGTNYNFNGKIQKIDKAPPIFSIVEKAQNGTGWDLKIKLTDYGYNVMSGNLVVKGPTGTILHTLTKSSFNSTTKLYTLTLSNSNSNGTLINGPYTFEYQASTNTAVYELVLNDSVLSIIAGPAGPQGDAVWGRWVGIASTDEGFGVSATSDAVYMTGYSRQNLLLPSSVSSSMGSKHGGLDNIDAFIIKYNLSGTAVWARWIGGSGFDRGFGVSATSDSVYVTGLANGDLVGMSHNGGAFVIKYSSNGNFLWGKSLNASGAEFSYSISATSEGVYITGYSENVFGGADMGMGTKPGGSGNQDAFIIKYSTSGNVVWARWIGGTGSEIGFGVSATSDAVYVTGSANAALTATTGLSAEILSAMGTKPGSDDAFIIKYNLSGTAVWARWIGGTGSDAGRNISATSDAVYVTGSANAALTATSGLSAEILSAMGTKPGSDDAFIIKYNLSGTAVWARWIGGTGSDAGSYITAVDTAIYVTGNANADLTPTVGLSAEIISAMGTKPPGSSLEIFIVKYNTEGTAVWARWVGGGGFDRILGISAIETAVYITGVADINLTVPNPTLIDMGTKPYGWNDPVSFIIKYV